MDTRKLNSTRLLFLHLVEPENTHHLMGSLALNPNPFLLCWKVTAGIAWDLIYTWQKNQEQRPSTARELRDKGGPQWTAVHFIAQTDISNSIAS